MSFNLPKPFKPVVDLCLHLVVGTIPFVLLLLLTSALETGVHWLEIHRWLTKQAATPLIGFKAIILYGDFFLYGLFWLAEMLRFAKSLMEQIKNG
ncbi:MAG: hypothetical protein ABIT69_00190 [Sphingomicrobium sp.]